MRDDDIHTALRRGRAAARLLLTRRSMANHHAMRTRGYQYECKLRALGVPGAWEYRDAFIEAGLCVMREAGVMR